MLLLCDGDKWKSHFCVSQELVKNLENGVMENEVVNVFFCCLFSTPPPVHRRRNRNFVFLRAQLEGHKNDQSLSYWELWTLLWVEDEVVKKISPLQKIVKLFCSMSGKMFTSHFYGILTGSSQFFIHICMFFFKTASNTKKKNHAVIFFLFLGRFSKWIIEL